MKLALGAITFFAAACGSVAGDQEGNPDSNLQLSVSSVQFDPQDIHAADATRTLTVTNAGDEVLDASVSISGDSQFTIATTDCGAELAVEASCSVEVLFAPALVGEVSATLTIGDNSANVLGTGGVNVVGQIWGSGEIVELSCNHSGVDLNTCAPVLVTTNTFEFSTTTPTSSLTFTGWGNATTSIGSNAVCSDSSGVCTLVFNDMAELLDGSLTEITLQALFSNRDATSTGTTTSGMGAGQQS